MEEKPYNKTKKHEKEVKEGKIHDCDFGQKSFNKTKRSKEFVEELNTRGKGKKPTPTTPTEPTQPPPPSTAKAVLLLDFDGGVVKGTSWNYNGDINYDYSGLSDDEKLQILQSMQEDYAPFNIEVTMDKALFAAAPITRRMRVIFTESFEWYSGATPTAGGVAYTGSFSWGSDTPCWIFTSALGYAVKPIKEAGPHEAGHTFGLRHQALWSSDCTLISSYNQGANGEAPIMGVGYYQDNVHWWVGPTSVACNDIQDDVKILTNVLGVKV